MLVNVLQCTMETGGKPFQNTKVAKFAEVKINEKHPTHQFSDLTLQVQNAVKLPLAAALRRDAVLTPPSHVVDELKLL